MVRRLSPDSLSITEFKSAIDVTIAEKMLQFPLLGENVPGKWKIKFTSEFHMTNDSRLFHKERQPGMLPLYEGKMMHQFTHQWGGTSARYWVDEKAGRAALLGKEKDNGQILGYQDYRFVYRRIGRNTDIRTLIATILPKNTFASESFHALEPHNLTHREALYLISVLNAFTSDYIIRQKISANLSMYFTYALSIPRYTEGDPYFGGLVERAARLICTTPEYDALAAAAGIADHRAGVTDVAGRARLRAEIDGLVAHLYRLTEAEYVHILGTFPLVAAPVKAAALAAFGAVARGEIK